MINLLKYALLALSAAISLPGCASEPQAIASHHESPRVLLVLTNTATIGDSDKPTGFFLSEASHPWAVFTEAGYTVTLASPKGGSAPIDPRSLKDIDDHGRAFLDAYARDEGGRRVVPNTVAIGSVDAARYKAVFFAGGHGTMWDFEQDASVAQLAASMYEQGSVVAAVCHGPAALVNARVDGAWLLDGKRVTGFTNAEEEAVELTDEMPFLLETRMTERGASFDAGENFKANVVRDGRLVTGQNPASAKGAAEAVVGLIDAGAE